MRTRRVLLVVFDGYDAATGEALADQGKMPALKRLMQRAARFDLEHGTARWTGLAGEHLSTGLSPEAAKRHAAITFDPERYDVRQDLTALAPFPAAVPARCVVFNPTYFDLARAPRTEGLTAWGGAHDPGAPAAARPESLNAEVTERFGQDPGRAWTYGIVWPSPARTAEMASKLTEALALKTRIAHWLLSERLPDWDLAIVGVGEMHSALEGMWHGIDSGHPLHHAASSSAARDGLHAVYRAADGLIGRLIEAFPDAAIVVTSLHGMGPNHGDLPSMALLPELLRRDAWPNARWSEAAPASVSALGEDGDWTGAARSWFDAARMRESGGGIAQILNPRRWFRRAPEPAAVAAPEPEDAMRWMPATWYRQYWPEMRSFALPAFYDGRVRINLAGRESRGRVAVSEYIAEGDRIEALVRECRNTSTGAAVVDSVERTPLAHAPHLGPTEADMIFRWRGMPTGFDHPGLGRIGPLPHRRTGGHTGGHGVAYIAGDGIAPCAGGERSAFDVVPTVFELMGFEKPAAISGRSLLAAPR